MSTSVSYSFSPVGAQTFTSNQLPLAGLDLHINATLTNSSGNGVAGQVLKIKVWRLNNPIGEFESDVVTDDNGFTMFTLSNSLFTSSWSNYKFEVFYEGGFDSTYNYLNSTTGKSPTYKKIKT